MPNTRRPPPDRGGPSSRPLWRRIFHWPVFFVLAAVHLLLLPLIISEAEDDRIVIGAGIAYLVLAIADWIAAHRNATWTDRV